MLDVWLGALFLALGDAAFGTKVWIGLLGLAERTGFLEDEEYQFAVRLASV